MEKVVKNKNGFFSVKELPTQQELETYYSEKYYQNESIQYSNSYSKDELKYFENRAKAADKIYHDFIETKNKTLLEVGAGEGFFSHYFFSHHWNVTTLDYSDYGIKHHNPDLLPTLIKGDIYNSLENLIAQNSKFDFINLSNVLEHVLNPEELLEQLKMLLAKNSLLRISVPNDYSNFQEFLMEKNYTSNTWLCPPEHLHYFTFDSLSNLLLSVGYKVTLTMGEFPIELFLSNESSNYAQDRDKGKFAHKSRIEVDNFLFNQGVDKYINFYEVSAKIGLSRQVVIYATLNEIL